MPVPVSCRYRAGPRIVPYRVPVSWVRIAGATAQRWTCGGSLERATERSRPGLTGPGFVAFQRAWRPVAVLQRVVPHVQRWRRKPGPSTTRCRPTPITRAASMIPTCFGPCHLPVMPDNAIQETGTNPDSRDANRLTARYGVAFTTSLPRRVLPETLSLKAVAENQLRGGNDLSARREFRNDQGSRPRHGREAAGQRGQEKTDGQE